MTGAGVQRWGMGNLASQVVGRISQGHIEEGAVALVDRSAGPSGQKSRINVAVRSPTGSIRCVSSPWWTGVKAGLRSSQFLGREPVGW